MERNRFSGFMIGLRERAGNATEKLITAMFGVVTDESTVPPKEMPRFLDYGNFPDSSLSPSDLIQRRMHEAELRDALDGTTQRQRNFGL